LHTDERQKPSAVFT